MKVLVTGGNGYLGGWTVDALLKRGHRVSAENSHGVNLLKHSAFPIREADAVVHLAWYSTAGDGQPLLQTECLERTQDLVRVVGKFQQFLLVSSASVYGDTGDEVVGENSIPAPSCAYSVAKCSAEELVLGGIPDSFVPRFGSLMGTGLTRTKTELVVNAFAKDGYLKRRVEVWNPSSWKPVLHVRDAAGLICEAVEKRWRGVLNAAEGSYRARDIARLAGEVTGGKVTEVGDRPGPRSCRLNCGRLYGLLPQWCPRGVADTIREFKGFRESPSDLNTPWTETR